ncbi:winged helix-turn-helix domain-containing protein [Candidatus Gracilibacteria bacterium]|nr:winged helix-turn-helix domain-containing protein [Candidatus Gracilibacteria bacterium]
MLKTLFTSNVRLKILKRFFLNTEKEYYVRELSRDLDEQVNAIRRELDSMHKIGLLKTRAKNRKKYFYLNKFFLIYNELSSIILKNFVLDSQIHEDLKKLGEINLLILNGIFIDKQKEADMLIVGEMDSKKLQEYLLSEIGHKNVKFSLMSKDEFQYRIDINDNFVISLIRDKDSIIPINKVKNILKNI